MGGYKRVWDNTLKTQVYVHRLVAAESLGRALLPGEVVHHLNGDKQDCRAENLPTLPSQAAHMALEHVERKRSRGMAPLFSLEEMVARSAYLIQNWVSGEIYLETYSVRL